MDRSLSLEAAQALADAREALAEWIEEGIDTWEAVPEPTAAPKAAPSFQLSPTPARLDTAAAEALAPAWGESPSLDDVRQHLGDCRLCELCEGRNTIVFGDGNPDADLMFIGEGPGQEEDRRGLPFVGRAGELLTQMIEKGLEIPRSSVYICNIVKCRPPKNRTPLPQEVSACRHFLDGQIDAVKPKVIVSLGKPAASLLLGRDVAITRLRGTWQEYRGIALMPTLHPAYLLRQYSAENRRNVWDDLKEALARSRS
ncbi:MAG: uracil-DNA glycosylase family protein [Myxococcota bacterium]|nr:uracil-DNA glycosylase family protein [Myxococcota bacterium]